MTKRWGKAATFVAIAATVAATTVGFAGPAQAATTSGVFHAVAPTRLLDTRTGLGTGAAHPVAPGGTIVLNVTNGATVPSGATAVVLNVTVTRPSSNGWITVYPDDATLPNASNLNFVAGQTVPNLVVTAVSPAGNVDLNNGSPGTVDLIADVSGYFTGSDSPSGQGSFGSVAPARVLDTRGGVAAGAVASGGERTFEVNSPVPPGAAAVVLNVTVTSPTAGGFITAYPTGTARPNASNLNFAAGQTVPNLVIVPLGQLNTVSLYNGSGGTVQLIADVAGYFLPGDPVNAGAFGALAPSRLLDTRTTSRISAFGLRSLRIGTPSGASGLPLANISAVVLNVTAVLPGAAGYLTVDPGPGVPPGFPSSSNLNFAAGQTVPNLVIAPVTYSGGIGTVQFYNGSSAPVDVIADVSGYFLSGDVGLPVAGNSEYIRNVDGTNGGYLPLFQEGCTDAGSGPSLVVLQFGAQSITPPLSAAPASPGPGVELTQTTHRLTYAQVVTAVQDYTSGFTTCPHPPHTTMAIGTNSSGVNPLYPAATKGKDWATQVVAALNSGAPTNITYAGAYDAEAGFGDTEGDAMAWETNYLAATTASLIFDGSLDACPSTYGASGDCGAVAGQNGANWTRAEYAQLATNLNPNRISALPQVFSQDQAVQWANVDVTAHGSLTFAGALTENQADPNNSLTPGAGWAALYHAISTVVLNPNIPVSTDLRID